MLNESDFIRFARDRGIAVSGVNTGDPGKFQQLGLLWEDELDDNNKPYFHPFRIYPLHRVISICDFHIASSASLYRERLPDFLNQVIETLPSLTTIEEYAQKWNAQCDIFVLLEPIFWPDITNNHTHSASISREEYESARKKYRADVFSFVQTLDHKEWQKVHEALRWEANKLDPNGSVYLFLRVGSWDRRKELKGCLSGALWLRHMAEVLRRGFEAVHEVRWNEEDQAGEQWFPGARRRLFGNDRPLDYSLGSKPYLAWYFGLFTGSVVRWYVEGDTEFHAVAAILPNAEKGGIELVNLRGNIREERANAAMRLSDGLQQDRNLRRFSIISFDTDVQSNVKAVRTQIAHDNVVGYITAHSPDFEFANFSTDELVEVAAKIDEQQGYPTDNLRNADWSGVTNAKDFENKYKQLSARMPRSLKGDIWGAALACYVEEHPLRLDTGTERPFVKAVDAALRSRFASYDYQANKFTFDPATFELILRTSVGGPA